MWKWIASRCSLVKKKKNRPGEISQGMSTRSSFAWSEAAGHTGTLCQLLLAQSGDSSTPPVKTGEGCFQTMVDLNSSPRTTALFLDYVQWLFKLPNCFSPHCTKSSKRKKNLRALKCQVEFCAGFYGCYKPSTPGLQQWWIFSAVTQTGPP